jgi:hypothetical protein
MRHFLISTANWTSIFVLSEQSKHYNLPVFDFVLYYTKTGAYSLMIRIVWAFPEVSLIRIK